METKKLGKTDIDVTRLGVGLAEIGYQLTFAEEREAGDVLNFALDGGINFLDTSACYDISEELLGRTVSHRRDEYALATKCGHVAGGYEGEDWTAQTVADSIDRSLTRMKTDYLDLVQLHSCGLDVLERGEVIEVLQAAQQAGKTRYIGYSGDNDAAMWAVESGYFDTLQTSFNLVEQKARFGLFEAAQKQEMGVIIKRPIANSVWGAAKSPRDYADEYFARAQQMAAMGPLPNASQNRIELSLAFTFAHEAVTTAIVGTRNPVHMRSNLEMLDRGITIEDETLQALYERYEEIGMGWEQLT